MRLKRTIWFPRSADKGPSTKVLNLFRVMSRFGSAMPPTILCFDKGPFDAIKHRFEDLDLHDYLTTIMTIPGIAKGYVIPTYGIPDDWIMDEFNPLFAMAKLARRITYSNEETSSRGSNGPMEAFRDGTGNCFDLATLLVAIARKNGFEARVVGSPTFFGEENLLDGGGDHWWVEIKIDGQWVPFDPLILDSVKEAVAMEAEHDKPKPEEMDLFFCQFLQLAIGLDIAPINPITNPEYDGKVAERVIALEVEVPEDFPYM